MRCICTFLVMAGMMTLPAFSQTSKKQTPASPLTPTAKDGDDDQSNQKLPTVVVDFEKPVALAGSSETPAFLMPVHCSMDGRVYVAQLVPPDYRMRIVGGTPGNSSETITLNPSSVEGFAGVAFDSFTVTPDGVTVLAYADPKDHPSDQAPYLISFDKHGQVTKTTKINVPFQVFRFGVFESGDIVVTGLEGVNKTFKVMLLNPSGEIIKYFDVGLDTDTEMHSAEETFRAQNDNDVGKDNPAVAVASLYFLVPHGQSFLLFSEDPKQPVYELGDGSIVHRTVVKYPPGDKAGFYVPTDGRNWLSTVSLMKPSGGSREEVVYEIDPDSGKFLRVFRTTGVPASIVCVSQSKIFGFRIESPSKKPELQVVTFDIK